VIAKRLSLAEKRLTSQQANVYVARKGSVT